MALGLGARFFPEREVESVSIKKILLLTSHVAQKRNPQLAVEEGVHLPVDYYHGSPRTVGVLDCTVSGGSLLLSTSMTSSPAAACRGCINYR